MRTLVVALLCLSAGAARAEGFAVRDLTTVVDAAKAVLSTGALSRAEPRRLTLSCPDCAGAPMIDLQLGRQTDGTEERVRSGQTSLDRLEALCRAKNPDCRLSVLSVAPALGWISSYPVGTSAGATAMILRDGDLLTIRALAGSREAASGHVAALVRAVAPGLVGR